MLAARSRSAALSGPDRLRSIRSRLILGLLLPYVCLMGVCTIALFDGPANTNRIPSILVILAAAVLLPLAMARIARGILSQAEALETERATLAAGQSLRDARAEAKAEAPVDAVSGTREESASEPAEVVDVAAEPMSGPAEPADSVSAADEVPVDRVDDIDENAPLAAGAAVEHGAAPAVEHGAAPAVEPVVEKLGPFAAFIAANRRAGAGSTVSAQAATDTVGAPVEPVDEHVDDEPLAAAVAAEAIATEPAGEQPAAADLEVEPAETSETDETPAPEAAPRSLLMPSAIGRQILTDTPAEPAA